MARRRSRRHYKTEVLDPSLLVKPTAVEVRSVVTKYFTDKMYAVNHELGLCRGGRYRADLVAFSMSGQIIVGEVKSSVADFTSDKKWHNYLPYCNKFYFCMDAAVYRKVKDRIPKGVGVILVKVYKQDGLLMATRMKIVQRADSRELDVQTQLNVTIRSVFRSSDASAYKKRRKNI